MESPVDLGSYRRARKQVSYQPDELRALMNLYSKRVMAGEWRDYAIDFRPGFASFSVFKNTFDSPLFSIVKVRPKHGGIEWLVFRGPERLKRAANLTDALAYFEKKLEVVS